MTQVDFDALWDYQHPDQTEAVFAQLLNVPERNTDPSYRLQLLTQIARAQGLQRQFAEAHHTLDRVKDHLSPELVVPTIRYLLERGRVFNSSGQPNEAQIWFQQAWELARGHEEAAFFAVDAAHMLAIASSSFEGKTTWNQTALDYAQASPDERARDGAAHCITTWAGLTTTRGPTGALWTIFRWLLPGSRSMGQHARYGLPSGV